MISEQKFRVETPYGVKIFQNLHFQKHPPIMEKGLAKKKFQYEMFLLSRPWTSNAFRMGGRPSVNWTSTTAPMTATI